MPCVRTISLRVTFASLRNARVLPWPLIVIFPRPSTVTFAVAASCEVSLIVPESFDEKEIVAPSLFAK